MPNRPCLAPSCSKISGRHSGFCVDHVRMAFDCCFDGCGAKVAAWNMKLLCKEHRWLAKK